LKRTVIVSGCGGRTSSPAEQRPLVLVVLTGERALGVEHAHVGAQYPERVGVERDGAPTVVGLAVLVDHLAVDDDAGGADGESACVEVEPVAVHPGQFAARIPVVTSTYCRLRQLQQTGSRSTGKNE
jgi:hypothetical protein